MVTARRAASRRSRRRALDRLGARRVSASDASEASEAALVLVAALGAHDRRTRGHSERVRTLADLLAKEAGVSDEDRDRLRWGALLHDIGKLAVPGAILNKPDRPDEEEWATLKRHPEEGAHLVEPLESPGSAPGRAPSGTTTRGGTARATPRVSPARTSRSAARILAIADAYEVMTAARAYKVPMSAAAARKELVASAGTHFDPALVRAFMGISLGALWWTTGVAALLAQIPLLGRVGAAPGLDQIRSGLAGSATAVATVAALVVAGRRRRKQPGEPAVARTAGSPVGGPGASDGRSGRHRRPAGRDRRRGGGPAPTTTSSTAAPVAPLDAPRSAAAAPVSPPRSPRPRPRRPARPIDVHRPNRLRPGAARSARATPFTAQGQLARPRPARPHSASA